MYFVKFILTPFFWIKIYFYKSVSIRFESQIEQQTGEALGKQREADWKLTVRMHLRYNFCFLYFTGIFFLFVSVHIFFKPLSSLLFRMTSVAVDHRLPEN